MNFIELRQQLFIHPSSPKPLGEKHPSPQRALKGKVGAFLDPRMRPVTLSQDKGRSLKSWFAKYPSCPEQVKPVLGHSNASGKAEHCSHMVYSCKIYRSPRSYFPKNTPFFSFCALSITILRRSRLHPFRVFCISRIFSNFLLFALKI